MRRASRLWDEFGTVRDGIMPAQEDRISIVPRSTRTTQWMVHRIEGASWRGSAAGCMGALTQVKAVSPLPS
jgi:hypothetical protein